ncbi:hypothetical protein ANCCAN_10980 [Ancylostoma caninum]|uniref:Uncharacterized protein n=1 Tax=Ancylostoma caninum TaxID=29170 RepID=A0A368GJ09_ANCCA|nr:hypothetical protein ANCCAN_10980 [Ancylostoma caninum]
MVFIGRFSILFTVMMKKNNLGDVGCEKTGAPAEKISRRKKSSTDCSVMLTSIPGQNALVPVPLHDLQPLIHHRPEEYAKN